MANPEHLAILKKGVKVWNAWRNEHPETQPDLSKIDVTGEGLRKIDLSNTILALANFTRANLERANLSGADLRLADLQIANLSLANLEGSNLALARLSSTNLTGAHFSATNISEATVGYTIFADNDLRGLTGLDTVKHGGPSFISVDSIFKSDGNIPLTFLRGAGVPEIFVEYMHSLVGQPFEFYSLFISYSTKDQDFAERLHADLQAKGVRCWFAPHDIQGGKKIHEQIDQAIRMHEKLLLILSPASMQSAWVETEISKARKREKNELKRVLFPI